VGPGTLDRLPSEDHPELAVVATWAVSHRHGPKAKAVVMRALEVTEHLPVVLQETQLHPDKIPMSPAALRFKAALQAEGVAKGLAEGARKALFTLLRTRGLSATAEEQVVVEGARIRKSWSNGSCERCPPGRWPRCWERNRKPGTTKPRIRHRAGR
jgi:hypothetical protein